MGELTMEKTDITDINYYNYFFLRFYALINLTLKYLYVSAIKLYNMSTINLNNLTGIPEQFIFQLKKYDENFRNNDSLEPILNDDLLMSLMKEINDFCNKRTLLGFHYTRAVPEEIAKNGLVCRTGEEIRKTFLSTYGYLFTSQELESMKKSWDIYFKPQQSQYRDNHLFFNFTTNALYDLGAEPLLNKYGGEQIHMPIQELQSVNDKLNTIGKPLILKCVLKPTDLTTFYDYPWGRIALSTYHNIINSNAYRDDQDGYQTINVTPENIEIIHFKQHTDYQNI